MRFPDRANAGRELGRALARQRGRDGVVVLGLAMGGIPVAAAVADALGAPLEAFVVRKLVAQDPEVAVGAVASGGIQVFDDAAIERWGIGDSVVATLLAQGLKELRKSETWLRAHRVDAAVRGAPVVLVDDLASTGVTMAAAITAVRRLGAREVTAAVPVGVASVLAVVEQLADHTVCLERRAAGPLHLSDVYDDWKTPSDEAVAQILEGRRPVA